MIRRKLCYLLLLGAGGYFMMLYHFQGIRFLFCCLLGVPLLSLFFLIPMRAACRVTLQAGSESVTRGEAPEVTVTVKNRGVLPLPRVLVELRWRVPGEGEVRIRQWLCGIPWRTRREIRPELPISHCGLAELTLARASVYDYLGIFSLPAGRRTSAAVCILPVVTPVSSVLEEAYSRILGGAGGEREGDLLLRDFWPGDSLHRVYWKLMAKGGELQVRDFERSASVTMYLRFSEELRAQKEQWDRYLDLAASLLCFLAEECRRAAAVSVEVVWRCGETCLCYAILDGVAVQAWLCALFRGEAVGTALSPEEIACLENGWRLEEDCRLYFGEQCIYEE